VIPYDEQLEHTVFTLANDMLKDICQVLACLPEGIWPSRSGCVGGGGRSGW